MIVAIDGPAAAGKGTLARRIAKELNFAYLDTGIIYRATGMKVVHLGGNPEDPVAGEKAARSLDPQTFDDPILRTDTAASAASKVSAIPAVRTALLDFQKSFAASPGGDYQGAVLDGRDIGTVVCPDAPAKLFITASMEVRAERRFKELQERGVEAIYARVLQDMKERDERDSSRATAPLTAAEDALVLDTSEMSADEVFKKALSFIAEKRG